MDEQKLKTQSYAQSQINLLLKSLQPQFGSSKDKKELEDFASYFFQFLPDVDENDVRTLLTGGDGSSRRGLLESCGGISLTRHRDVKGSAILSLDLVLLLLVHDPRVRELTLRALHRVDAAALREMRLAKHILSERGNPDIAYKVIWSLKNHLPHIPVHSYVESPEALQMYRAYEAQRADEERDDADDDDEGAAPRTWAEAAFDPNFEAEEERALAEEGAGQDSGGDDSEDGAGGGDDEDDPLGIVKRSAPALVAQSSDSGGGGGGGGGGGVWSSLRERRQRRRGKQKTASSTLLGKNLAPSGSTSTSREDFNAVLFLSKVHGQASLDELQRGYERLQQVVTDRNEQMKQLVKRYFAQFVSCKQAIDMIHKDVAGDLRARGKGRSQRLEGVAESNRDRAEHLYRPVLEKKALSDRMRATLGVLRRYRFVLALPSGIRESYRRRRYEDVVREYSNAKALVIRGGGGAVVRLGATGVEVQRGDGGPEEQQQQQQQRQQQEEEGEEEQEEQQEEQQADKEEDAEEPGFALMRRVLAAVHAAVVEVRAGLLERLERPHAPLSEQLGIVSTLRQLDSPEDPAYYFLGRREAFVHAELEASREAHAARLLEAEAAAAQQQPGAAPLMAGAGGVAPAAAAPAGAPAPSKADERARQRVAAPAAAASAARLVAEHCSIATSGVVGFYALARSLGAKDDRVQKLVEGMLQRCSENIRAALFPAGMPHRDGPYAPLGGTAPPCAFPYAENTERLTDGVVRVSAAHQRIRRGGIPLEYVLPFRQLAADTTSYFVTQEMRRALVEVSRLHEAEEWAEQPDAPGTTLLPTRFAAVMTRALRSVGRVADLDASKGTVELLGAPFLECARAFADVLHSLAFDDHQQQQQQVDERVRDARIVAVLGNVIHTGREVLPALRAAFSGVIPATASALVGLEFEGVQSLYRVLESHVLALYVRRKTLAVRRVVQRGVVYSGFAWDDAGRDPHAIRTYAVDVLIAIVFMHSEVSARRAPGTGTRVHAPRILSRIADGVAAAFADSAGEVDAFSPHGAAQLLAETRFVRGALAPFETDHARRTYAELDRRLEAGLRSGVGSKRTPEQWERVLARMLDSVRTRTRSMFQCLAAGGAGAAGEEGGQDGDAASDGEDGLPDGTELDDIDVE